MVRAHPTVPALQFPCANGPDCVAAFRHACMGGAHWHQGRELRETRGGQENRYWWWWLLIVGVHRYTGTTFYRPVTPSPRCSQAAPHRRYFARSHCTPSRRSCPMSTKVTTLDLRRFRSCGHRARQGGPVQRRFTGAALGGPPLPRMLCRNSQFGHGCLYDRNGQNFLARKGRQVGTAAPSC